MYFAQGLEGIGTWVSLWENKGINCVTVPK